MPLPAQLYDRRDLVVPGPSGARLFSVAQSERSYEIIGSEWRTVDHSAIGATSRLKVGGRSELSRECQ